MDKIFEVIKEERERQDEKWGEQNHDPFTWLAILGEEKGEVDRAALEARFGKYEHIHLGEYYGELIQVAAVAVAMIECLERKKWSWAFPRKYQSIEADIKLRCKQCSSVIERLDMFCKVCGTRTD